jgi:hypothetical protein
MNQYLTYLRLLNRAFIKSTEDDKLGNLHKIVDLISSYGLETIVGTAGGSEPGPFIESIFIPKEGNISADNFGCLMLDLCEFLDVYNGQSPFTFLEFNIKYDVSSEDTTMRYDATSVVFFDYKTKSAVLKLLKPEDSPILNYNKTIQKRIEVDYISQSSEALFSEMQEAT